jgi:hypothetical protein
VRLLSGAESELGHGRSFSLDTGKNLRERSAYLRTF